MSDIPTIPELQEVWDAASPWTRHEPADKGCDELWDKWGLGISRLLPRDARGTFLDWGYGGGALHRALLDRVQGVYWAVDVSETPLATAEQNGAKPVRPEKTSTIPPGTVDVVVSAACFQHFPSQEYGAAVVREMARVMRPGGHGLVQIRYCVPGDRYDPEFARKGAYADHYIDACAWQVPEFWAELRRANLEPTSVELDTVTPCKQYAFYSFRKP